MISFRFRQKIREVSSSFSAAFHFLRSTRSQDCFLSNGAINHQLSGGLQPQGREKAGD